MEPTSNYLSEGLIVRDSFKAASSTFLSEAELFKTKEVEETTESETEDEEVKMNCAYGARGLCDSDMNTDDDCSFTQHKDEEEEEEEDVDDASELDEDDENADFSEREGVVNFVKDRYTLSGLLLRPQATTPPRSMLSPFDGQGPVEPASEADSRSSTLLLAAKNSEDSGSESDSESSEASDYPSLKNDEDTPLLAFEDPDDGESATEEDNEVRNLVIEGNPFDASDADSSSMRFIGVTEDRQQDMITVPKAKRVLSFSSFAVLNQDSDLAEHESKRRKACCCCSSDNSELGLHVQLSLHYRTTSLPTEDLEESFNRMQDRLYVSPVFSTGNDQELDQQLEDELIDDRSDEDGMDADRVPVPLLTPPGSPVTVDIHGERTTVCEWPSNLAVDSAITACLSEIRPLSPESLQDFEKEYEFNMKSVMDPSSCALNNLRLLMVAQ